MGFIDVELNLLCAITVIHLLNSQVVGNRGVGVAIIHLCIGGPLHWAFEHFSTGRAAMARKHDSYHNNIDFYFCVTSNSLYTCPLCKHILWPTSIFVAIFGHI